MAHHTLKSSYARLTERLNRFPQGAPPSELLFRILRMLFSEREAEQIALLPIKPFTAEKAARLWKIPPAAARNLLDAFCSRGLLVDMEQKNRTVYTLPPPMAGFFEFSLMRVRADIDQGTLSTLFHQYLNVEEDFLKDLFGGGEIQLGRILVHEPVLSGEESLHVLDHERATETIKNASHIGVGLCFCRHKKSHLDQACEAPLAICMSLNLAAASLIKHGFARRVESAEGLDLLQTAYGHNLVQFGENVREGMNFICHCCSCCCDALFAARRFGMLQPVHTTGFIPEVQEFACSGCGKCAKICPVDALTLTSCGEDPPARQKVRLEEERCLGCGLCLRACPSGALRLRRRPQQVITPVNSVHRTVLMAVERGTLQHLIFDNRVLWSHRALAAVLGAILKLAPVKRALAGRQLRSRYLEFLVNREFRTWEGAK